MIELFHFLRPAWLLLLIPLLFVGWLLLRARYGSANWRGVIDERLLPFVLRGENQARRSILRWLLLLAALLAVLALAGPTWEKLPQPVYHKNASIVIALDLSRSMDATDIKPSRLARARHKIADILNLKLEGQSALVVYAADAFTVTPLTTDIDTILALLPGLDSQLMPAQGSRADRAIALAFDLLANAGVRRGDILLVSDGLSEVELGNIQELRRKRGGHRLSVLAVGSSEGGPIPLKNGGFLKDGNGELVIDGLREDKLRALAQSGGGVYAVLAADDIDINSIGYLFDSNIDQREASLSDLSADLWRELGPWLILLSLPLVALIFRRGVVLGLPLLALLLPPQADAVDWRSLWLNDDQRASEAFDQGRYAESAALFDDEAWRAAAKFNAGDYQGALEMWAQQDSEAALFNSANALAGMGRLEEAVQSLDRLLERNPNHADARQNKKTIEEMMRQRKQQQQQGQGDGQSGSASDDDSQRNDSGDPSSQQSAQPGRQNEPDGDDGDQPQQASGQPVQPDESDDGLADEQASAQAAGAEPSEAPSDPQEVAGLLDEQMNEQAVEQWLRKIPDDPGGLLRRKFLYQYRKRGGVATEAQPW